MYNKLSTGANYMANIKIHEDLVYNGNHNMTATVMALS